MKDPAYWDTAILRAAGRLLMLAAFDEQPGHGYDVARRLTGICGDWCNPSPAMIYPAIHELEAAGLIACEVDPGNARKRRICTLTDSGREALAVGRKAWAGFLPAMMRVVGEQPAATACDAEPATGASCGESRLRG